MCVCVCESALGGCGGGCCRSGYEVQRYKRARGTGETGEGAVGWRRRDAADGTFIDRWTSTIKFVARRPFRKCPRPCVCAGCDETCRPGRREAGFRTGVGVRPMQELILREGRVGGVNPGRIPVQEDRPCLPRAAGTGRSGACEGVRVCGESELAGTLATTRRATKGWGGRFEGRFRAAAR